MYEGKSKCRNKKVVLITMMTLLSVISLAQEKSVTDTIEVGFTKSIMLLFDGVVKTEKGSEDIIVKEADHKVILQAAVESFEETNLFVECEGNFYVFIIRYNEAPSRFFFNYQKKREAIVQGEGSESFRDLHLINRQRSNQIKITKLDSLYKEGCRAAGKKTQGIRNRGAVKGKILFIAINMFVQDSLYYLVLSIENKSKVSYEIDYIQFSVKDFKTTIKGSAQQVIPIRSRYVDNKVTSVKGKTAETYVYVVEKFVIQKDKKFIIELWEHNGGLNREGGRKMEFALFSEDILEVKELVLN